MDGNKIQLNFLKEIFRKINPFFIFGILISALVAIPIVIVVGSFLEDTSEYFLLMKNTFLIKYISNSIFILIGTLSFTFIFGFFAAYFISFFSFTGANFFRWSLILSFAIPPYIFAYSLNSFFENYGLAYSIMTHLFGEGNYNQTIPKFDGIIGSIISLSFTLFGYIFVLSSAAFLYKSNNLFDVGKNLGFSLKKTFLNIIFPIARPSIFVGLTLVTMEVLSDFGTVSFFSVSTLTTGIYESWVTFDDLATANRLSFVLVLFIFVLFVLEHLSRGNAQYHNSKNFNPRKKYKTKLKGLNNFLVFSFCSCLFLISFIFPFGQMSYWALKNLNYLENFDIITLNFNTLYLVFVSSIILTLVAFIANISNRFSENKILNTLNNFSISGYAIPGVILGLTLLTFSSWLTSVSLINFKYFIIGTSFGIVLAYVIRFYALSYNSINSNYLKINKSIDESAYLLGFSKYKVFSNIHFPFLKNSFVLIFVLISIEIIKELPIVLILRPYNFETFSTRAFSYAEQDLVEAAAFPSLFLIAWSTLFIIISINFILPKVKNV